MEPGRTKASVREVTSITVTLVANTKTVIISGDIFNKVIKKCKFSLILGQNPGKSLLFSKLKVDRYEGVLLLRKGTSHYDFSKQ